MILTKIIEKLYVKLYLSIVTTKSSTLVSVETLKAGMRIDFKQAEFDESQTMEFIEYVKNATTETPFNYISFLDDSMEQGALGSCQKSETAHLVDLSLARSICYDEKFMTYTPSSNINRIKEQYKEIGLDYIFSPFLLLRNFYADKISDNFGLYVLVQDKTLTLAVFSDAKLLFSDYVDTTIKTFEDVLSDDSLESEDSELDFELDDLGLEDGINLDDIDAIDNLNDIEDLDSIEEIEEFSDIEDLEESLPEEISDEHIESKIDDFSDDYERFSMIQGVLQRYYSDDRYENNFVEHIFIADAVGVSDDLKRYLEEELFVSVIIRSVDIQSSILELAKEESRYA